MYAQATSTLLTVRDLLRFAVTRFNHAELTYGHGTTNAYDEAAYLILSTLKLPVDQLEPYLDARLLPEEIQDVLELIARRAEERVPVAYLTHEAWQGDFNFYVDERVLVPRSFIYELLGEPLAPWIEFPELVHRALDLCTGSGCLAILTALAFPNAEVDAVDLSQEALAVAERNIADYRLQDRVHPVHSDAFAALDLRNYRVACAQFDAAAQPGAERSLCVAVVAILLENAAERKVAPVAFGHQPRRKVRRTIKVAIFWAGKFLIHALRVLHREG